MRNKMGYLQIWMEPYGMSFTLRKLSWLRQSYDSPSDPWCQGWAQAVTDCVQNQPKGRIHTLRGRGVLTGGDESQNR